MKTESLTISLLNLAKLDRDNIKKAIKNGLIKKVRVPYTKDKFKEFKYKKGSISYSLTTEQFVKEELDQIQLINYKEQKKETKSGLQKIIQQVSSTFKLKESQAEYYVSRFLDKVFFESLEKASDDKLFELTVCFIKDLEGAPQVWTPIIWLKGIWLVNNTVQLSNLVFKKPTPSDVEREWQSAHPYFVSWPRDIPTAILNMSFRAKNQREAQRELERLIYTLRLFKVGSIINIRTFWITESILAMRGISSSSILRSSTYRYSLSKTDIPKLETFIEVISPLIPIELIDLGQARSDQVDYAVISIQRYCDALLKSEIIESRLTFAIMCLESLYLKEEERGELKHRLSQRTSKVLGFFGYNHLEVYNELKRSYDIRSSFVHGSPIHKDRLQEASKLAENVIKYARGSIILMLQLKPKYDKDKFLNVVDNSLLSKETHYKLEKLLKENCLVF